MPGMVGRSLSAGLLLAAAVSACGLMEGRRERHEADAIGRRLVATGFRAVPADTAAKQAHLERMPKLLFSSVVQHGQRRWVLADPDLCRCLYVGDEAAYRRYTALEISQEEASSTRAARRDDRNAGTADAGPDSIGPFQGDVGPAD